MYNVGESGVWEELMDDFRVSREEVMDVKRRDGVRLRFNELVHMVFTGEGRDMSWEEHDSVNASKKEVVQRLGGKCGDGVPSASCRSWMVSL